MNEIFVEVEYTLSKFTHSSLHTVSRHTSRVFKNKIVLLQIYNNNNILFYITENSAYWIGLTDLKEGQFRWSYDQSIMTYKNWFPSGGWGSKGQGSDCVILNGNENAYWLDYNCTYTYYYICESDFCKSLYSYGNNSAKNFYIRMQNWIVTSIIVYYNSWNWILIR